MTKGDLEAIRVVYQDMPAAIKGFCKCDDFGEPTIILNSRLSYDQNLATYWHEIEHIEKNDFCKGNLSLIEIEGHNLGG